MAPNYGLKYPKCVLTHEGSHQFLRHLGTFDCIQSAVFSENSNLSKSGFLKNFIAPFPQTVWSKIRRISEFSTHLYILQMRGKLQKLKVATQYLTVEMVLYQSYFLRKWTFFFKKNQKKTKKDKKNVFFLPTSHYHLTLGSVRKNISKKFPSQFYTKISKFQPIFKFCLGQR